MLGRYFIQAAILVVGLTSCWTANSQGIEPIEPFQSPPIRPRPIDAPKPERPSAFEGLYVTNRLQNFKRGTIHIIHPETRSFSIIWEDLGRVKMKAADLVVNFPALRVGQIVDVHWYDYMDFLITKKTPESSAHARAIIAQGARLEGIPGAQQPIRLWAMEGMVTKVDLENNVIYLINSSGGEPDKPTPDSGEIIQMPQIVTDAGKAALRTIQPGDQIIVVFSQQTAVKATAIR